MDNIICLKSGDFLENCYLFSYDDKLCIVDPGDFSTSFIHTLNKTLDENKLKLSSVFLTHGHLDHVAGLGRLKNMYPEIKIYINEKDSLYIGKGSFYYQYDDFSSCGMGIFVDRMLPAHEDLPQADYLYKDAEFLFGDWQVIESPGHTQGSSCLYNKKRKLLFTGDTLMFSSYGRTDMTGGSDLDMAQSLKRLYQLPSDTLVYPGHDDYGFELGKALLWSYNII
ncbi:MAG: MBL fold metallo-hydrolase [Treponemataceae bacterium]|nr:MBL fold metallo-hydrolase [Treponemataceae bacterium]